MKAWIKEKGSMLVPVLGLIVVLAFFGIASGGAIFQGNNLATVVNQAFTTVIVAVGLAMIYAQGGMDFSPGGVIALCTLCAVAVADAMHSTVLVLPVCIVVGMLCYFVTGYVTVGLNLNPYIGSVSMMFLTRGIVNSVLQGKYYTYVNLGLANNIYVRFASLVAIIFIGWLMFNRTKLGRISQAYGENPVAAAQVGMPLKRYRLYAYLFGGAVVGVAAYFLLARTTNVSTSTGLNEEMNVIIALALGGMAMSGGVRTAIRCGVIGGVIISVLVNGMVVIGVPIEWTHGVRGIIFLVVVSISFVRDKGSKLLPR